MTTARAVVIGAGVGGLAAAAGLRLAGWDVTVCERASSLEPIGAALALAPNGLRALDTIGAGDGLRSLAVPQEVGIRRSDGRWLMRSATGRMISDRFGDRSSAAPDGRNRRAGVLPPRRGDFADHRGDIGRAGRECPAGRDGGAGSHHGGRPGCRPRGGGRRDRLRNALGAVSGHPGLRYAGFTTWRLLTGPVTGSFPMAESWGRGTVFGVMPLSGGRVYCYAAAPGRARRAGRRRTRRVGQAVRHVARADPGAAGGQPTAGRPPP